MNNRCNPNKSTSQTNNQTMVDKGASAVAVTFACRLVALLFAIVHIGAAAAPLLLAAPIIKCFAEVGNLNAKGASKYLPKGRRL